MAYSARTFTANALPSVGYIPDSFGRSFDQSQQALAGRTQRSYSFAGNNAANQIGGSGGAAFKSILNAQGANAGALANIDALTQRQNTDLSRQALALQGGVAQNSANQAAFDSSTQDRQYGAGLDQNQNQFSASQAQQNAQYNAGLNQNQRQFDSTFGEGQREYNEAAARQGDQFTRSLGENSRQFDSSQRGNVLHDIIGNLTANSFDALSNLPPELAGLLQGYLGSLGGGTGTGASSKPGTTGTAPAWKPTSGASNPGNTGANTPYGGYSGPFSPYASPARSYGPPAGSGASGGWQGANPYAPQTWNQRRF